MPRNKYPEQTVEKILDAATIFSFKKDISIRLYRTLLTKHTYLKEPYIIISNQKKKLHFALVTAWVPKCFQYLRISEMILP